jgi:glycosyltransferase involved in cell wall biosynthesis
MTQNDYGFSVIIPVYNEAGAITGVLDGLKKALPPLGLDYEIIVVDDGSTDGTGEVLAGISGITIVKHPYNKGYGASIKSGARTARHGWLMLFDGDGQHKPECAIELFRYRDDFDMVVGSREGYQGPWVRQPGKRLLTTIASLMADFKIPDLNSGLRLIRKGLFFRYIHLYPNNFSLTTTITMIFLKEALSIKYVPITINKRIGVSTVKPRDAAHTFILIMRIITLFSPMRFFFPVSFILMLVSLIMIIHDLVTENITDATVITLTGSILIFFFGILLDQIASLRREINVK